MINIVLPSGAGLNMCFLIYSVLAASPAGGGGHQGPQDIRFSQHGAQGRGITNSQYYNGDSAWGGAPAMKTNEKDLRNI